MKQLRAWMISFPATLAAQSAFAAEEGQIPQMDMTWYPNQLLWLAVSFVVLYVIVSRKIAPNIAGVLNARESAITDAIREAEAAKREAESTRGDFESSTNTARAKAAELMASAQAHSNAEAAAALASLDHELAQKAERAQARLSDAVAKAQSGVEAATVSLASAMAEKLLGHTVSADKVTDAVKPLAKAS